MIKLPTKRSIDAEFARRKLIKACQFLGPIVVNSESGEFEVGPHHEKICDKLEEVAAGTCKRLMVFVPPQYGKSTIVSQIFPNWLFGQRPKTRIIQTGYSKDIALYHSRLARRIANDPIYAELWPEMFAKNVHESDAANYWENSAGGVYYAAGFQGGITGRGADIGIIDDPIKNREEANSKKIRDKVFAEYKATLYTRISVNGAIILVMTRWHPDDLAGRLLNEMREGGEQWDILSLPALSYEIPKAEFDADTFAGFDISGDTVTHLESHRYDPPKELLLKYGKPLWPQRWSVPDLLRVKAVLGTDWDALYQQQPRITGGAIFRLEWLTHCRFEVDPPSDSYRAVSRVISWDTAEKCEEQNAFSSWSVGELMPEYRANLVENDQGKWEFVDLLGQIIYQAKRWNKDGKLERILIEDKSSGTALIQALIRQAPEWMRKLIMPVQPKGDKVQRANQAATWVQLGCVWLPKPNKSLPWLYEFEDDFANFPAVAYKDRIDSYTQLIWYWENILARGQGIQLVRDASTDNRE